MKIYPPHRLLPVNALLAVVFSTAVLPVVAQTTWDGDGGDRNWSNADNWTAEVPGTGSNVLFNNVDTNNALPSLIGSNLTIGSLRFAPTANSQTIQHAVEIATGSTLTINGTGSLKLGAGSSTTGSFDGTITNVTFTGGALVVNNTSGLLEVGMRNTNQNNTQNQAVLDLRGLDSFTANVNQLRVGYESRNRGIMYLSDTANTITANIISVGNSLANNASPDDPSAELRLGAGTNNILTDTLDIGRGKSPNAYVRFDPGDTTGSVVIGSKTPGVGTNINVGVATEVSTGAQIRGSLLLEGHDATVTANTLRIGYRTTSGAGATTTGAQGTVTFDEGTFTVNDLLMAERASTTAGKVDGILTVGGGTFTVNDNFVLAKNLVGNTTSAATGTLNLTGGTFISNADILDGGGLAASIINLQGGTLDMRGNNIGRGSNSINNTHHIDTLNFQSGILMNIGEINGGETGLTKSGAGTLILDGENTYTGGTIITAGTLQVGNGQATGTLGSGEIVLGGTLTFMREGKLLVDQDITGFGGTIRQEGDGIVVLAGNNAMNGLAKIHASNGVLVASNSNALGTSSDLFVDGGEFRFVTGSSSQETLVINSLNLEDGSRIGVGMGDTIQTGSVVAASNPTVNLGFYSDFGFTPTAGATYNLLTSTGGGLDTANYSLLLYNATDYTATLNPVTGSQVSVTIDQTFDPGDLDGLTFYWAGGQVSGAENVWAVSAPGGMGSNWSIQAGFAEIVPVVPGTGIHVVLSMLGQTGQGNMALGADMNIRSLSADGERDTSAIKLSRDGHMLTINGVNDQGNTIYVDRRINGGVELAADVELAGTAPVITVGATDNTFIGEGSLVMSGILSGANGFTKQGGGVMTLSGLESNVYTGTLQMLQGTLRLAKISGQTAVNDDLVIGGEVLGAPSTGAVILDADEQIADDAEVTINSGSSLDLHGFNETTGALSGTGRVTNSAVAATSMLTVGFGGADGNFAGIIQNGSGTTALTKVGAGVQTLSGANTYTGLTSILEGTLRHGANNAIASGAVTVNGDTAVWDLNGFSDTVGLVTLEKGQIIGAGSTLTSTQQFLLRSGSVSASLAGSNGLRKESNGVASLSGENTFTGTVKVDNGVLKVLSNGALGAATNTVEVSGDSAQLRDPSLWLEGGVTVNIATLRTSGAGSSVNGASGVLYNHSGTNTINVSGSIAITGGNGSSTYFSQDGLLILNAQSLSANTSGRTLTLAGDGDGILNLSLQNGSTVNLPLFKNGAGTWTLTGQNTYTGATTVNGGLLKGTNKDALGDTSKLTVKNGAAFHYQSGTDMVGLEQSDLVVGALELEGGSRIGVELGNLIQSTAAATTAGTVTVDVFGISGMTYAANGVAAQYDVIVAPSGLDGASYQLGAFYNLTNFTVSGVDRDADSVWLNIVGQEEMDTLYWKGGFSGGTNVWAISDGSTTSNWVMNQDGTGNTALVPGSGTDAIFAATGATNQSDPMVLGASMGIGSLTFNGAGDVHLLDLANNLTLHKENAIVVNNTAGAVTLETNLYFANVNAMIDVALGETLRLGTIRGDNGFTKVGDGILELIGNTTNDSTGAFKIHNGTALLNKGPGASAVSSELEIGDSGGSVAMVKLQAADQIADDADVTVNTGGTMDLNGFNETIDGLNGTGVVTSTNGAATISLGGGNSTGANFGGVIQDGGTGHEMTLRKVGSGSQTLSGGNTYSGGTLIEQGTLILGADNTLPTDGIVVIGTGSSVGHLDVGGNHQTVSGLRFGTTSTLTANTVNIDAGGVLTVDGTEGFNLGFASRSGTDTSATFTGDGALVVDNEAANFDVGYETATPDSNPFNEAVLNMADLGSFTANVNQFRVGYGLNIQSTMTLSDSANRITANSMHVGDSTTWNARNGVLNLGNGINDIQVDQLLIGVGKANGRMQFSAAGSGSVKIGGKSGEATDIIIGSTGLGGTGATPNGTLDLRGHTAEVVADDLIIGRRTSTGNGGAVGQVFFDTGTFEANNVQIAVRGATNVGAVTGTLNVSGGVFTVNNQFTLVSNTAASSGDSGTGASGTLNLTGGKLISHADIVKVVGGSSNATKATATILLDGGELDMQGNNIGSGTNQINTLNFRSGVLKNVAEINGGLSTVTKTGPGTLYLDGVNAFTGATSVNEGRLFAQSSTALAGTSGVTVQSGAVFTYASGQLGQNLAVGGGVGPSSTLALQDNSRVGVELGNQIQFGGAATTTDANVSVDVYGISGVDYNQLFYDVITAASGLAGNAGTNYTLGNYYNRTNFTVTEIVKSDTYVRLNISTGAELTQVYWNGQFSGANNVWAISNADTSNWVTNADGTGDTGFVPGESTRVIFSANEAENQESMVLGADMSVGELEFNGAADTDTKLDDTHHKLTLNNEDAITVNGEGSVTLNTQLNFANANATLNVVPATGELTLSGLHQGQNLSKEGAGRTTLDGVGNYTGAVSADEGVMNVVGSLQSQGFTLASGARLEGSGSVDAGSGPVTLSGLLAVGDGRVSTPVATQFDISTTGLLTFDSTSTLTFDLISGAGSRELNEGQSDMLVVDGSISIQSGATLELTNPNAMVEWALGDTWKLFDWTGVANMGSRGSDFALGDSFESLLAGTGLMWDISDLYNGGTISVALVPEPSRALLAIAGIALVLTRRRRKASTAV